MILVDSKVPLIHTLKKFCAKIVENSFIYLFVDAHLKFHREMMNEPEIIIDWECGKSTPYTEFNYTIQLPWKE